MGLQLPPELAEALNWVGFTWPAADRNGVNNVPLFGFDGRTRLN
ncbi:hypothetical protein ACTFTM_24995 [Micromonospora sp. RB23]